MSDFRPWKEEELKQLVALTSKTPTGARPNFTGIADTLNAKFGNGRTGSACKTKMGFLRKKGRL